MTTISSNTMSMIPLILRLDVSGLPVRWIPWQDAVSLYSRKMVSWTAGEKFFTFHGGYNRITGTRSVVTINSIIAIKYTNQQRHVERVTPPLTNKELFLRDAYLCMYCGNKFDKHDLTRDHVLPISKGGRDRWSNVVSSCKSCNVRKGNRKPEEARMSLLAIPYAPNWAEYLALSNRRIMADQMEFLKSQFSNRKMAFCSNLI